MEYLGLCLTPYFFSGFLKEIFKNYFIYFHRIAFFGSTIFGTLVIFFPADIFTQKVFLLSMLFFAVFNMVAAMVLFIYLHLKRNLFAKYCLFSMGIFFVTVLLDILNNFHFIHYELKLAPLGFLFWIVSQSYILAVKFSNAYEVSEKLSKDLEKEVKERTQELFEEKNSVANLLDNMGQAVFTIDIEGTIQSKAVSQYSEIIFGKNIKNQNFYDLAYPKIEKGSEEHSAIMFAMSTCFESDHIQWELNQGLLPKKSVIQVKDKTKII